MTIDIPFCILDSNCQFTYCVLYFGLPSSSLERLQASYEYSVLTNATPTSSHRPLPPTWVDQGGKDLRAGCLWTTNTLHAQPCPHCV